MNNKIKIIGLSGSLRRASYNTGILREAIGLVPENSELEILEIGQLPLYNQDLETDPPKAVKEFKQKIKESDAVLFTGPEYNYSISGVLKNAIDWASRPGGDNSLAGKATAIVGASLGILGTARMQYHLRQVMVSLDMHPLNRPEVMIGLAQNKFDAEGKLIDSQAREKIAEILKELVTLAIKIKQSYKH